MWDACGPAGTSSWIAALSVNWELVGATVALIGLLLAGVTVWVWMHRWRRQILQDGPAEELDLRALLEQGVLTQEEFDRIRTNLEQRISRTEATPGESQEPSAPAGPSP